MYVWNLAASTCPQLFHYCCLLMCYSDSRYSTSVNCAFITTFISIAIIVVDVVVAKANLHCCVYV